MPGSSWLVLREKKESCREKNGNLLDKHGEILYNKPNFVSADGFIGNGEQRCILLRAGYVTAR